MYTVTTYDLRFQHFIEGSDGLIFACARDSADRVRNFLINRRVGVVLEQARNSFTGIDSELAAFVVENFDRKTAISYRVQSISLN